MNILRHSRAIFFIGIILGILLPQGARFLTKAIVPILIIMMTFSLKTAYFHGISHLKKRQMIVLIALNMILFSGLLLIAAFFFVDNPDYQSAFFILAMMPPAIGVISMVFLLKADIEQAFATELVSYLIALVSVPLLSKALFGSSVGLWEISKIVLLVILLPFVLAKLLQFIERKTIIKMPWEREVINLCYALAFYTIIGVNADILFSDWRTVLIIFAIFVVIEFGLMFLLYFATRHDKDSALYVIFGTFKNGGAAMAITILLIGTQATLPFAVSALLSPLHIILIQWLYKSS
ncbi:MAG: hypothetical protein ABIH34_06115 [Nanoarchaeota archaeon]